MTSHYCVIALLPHRIIFDFRDVGQTCQNVFSPNLPLELQAGTYVRIVVGAPSPRRLAPSRSRRRRIAHRRPERRAGHTNTCYHYGLLSLLSLRVTHLPSTSSSSSCNIYRRSTPHKHGRRRLNCPKPPCRTRAGLYCSRFTRSVSTALMHRGSPLFCRRSECAVVQPARISNLLLCIDDDDYYSYS